MFRIYICVRNFLVYDIFNLMRSGETGSLTKSHVYIYPFEGAIAEKFRVRAVRCGMNNGINKIIFFFFKIELQIQERCVVGQ